MVLVDTATKRNSDAAQNPFATEEKEVTPLD